MATIRQKVLGLFYPLLMKVSGRKAQVLRNPRQATPPASVYALSVQLNNGRQWPLSEGRGRKLLVVNTASDCGYTRQYEDLQELHRRFGDRLTIIGFPSNDFKEQEKGSDEEIASFCRLNYGVTFPLARKSRVSRGKDQHPLFRWLSSKEANGWNSQAPSWNFSKYLINEDGILTHYFDPSVSPTGPEVIEALAS